MENKRYQIQFLQKVRLIDAKHFNPLKEKSLKNLLY